MLTLNVEYMLAIVAFAWHYCLFCGYVSDDHATVALRKDIIPDAEKQDRGEGYWVKRLNDGLVMFYQTAFFHWLGLRNAPFAWHAFSLILHLTNVYLLHIFLLPIFGYEVALFASCFWGINPMLNQNVVWISGRPYLIGTMFALISLICWDQWFVFMPFYLLAVITNISIFFVPIIAWIIHPDSMLPKMYCAFMLVSAVPFLIWKFKKRFTKGLVIDRDNFAFRPRKVFTFARMIAYYIWTLFVPVRMGWYHQAGFRYNEQWEKFNYINFVGFGLLIYLVAFAGIPGWIFILGLLPVCNIYATNSFLQDRYLYFCSIGIAVIVAPILAAYPAIFLIATTFYVTRTYMYSRHLKDDEALYRENWRNHPKSDYAVNNLSYFLIQQKRYEEAQVVIEQGLEINPMNKMLHYNLGITFAARGNVTTDEGKWKFIRALEEWKTCLAIEPRWTKPAEDLKKLIKILVEHKVITLDPGEGVKGVQVTVPKLKGMEDIMNRADRRKAKGK